jgi:hypothetical protein
MMRRESITYNLINFIKKNYPTIAVILISILFFSSILSSTKTLDNIHYINDMTFQSENIRKSLFEGSGFPLWTPYFYSGQPFLAVPEFYLFDLNFIFLLLSGNIYLAMNLAVIAYFSLAGIGMYLLIYELMRNKFASFLGAIIFMFNIFVHKFILTGHLNILESYALLPFIFLFVRRAFQKDDWLFNSAIVGILMALMVYSGGMVFFLYALLLISLFLAFNLIGKNLKKNIIRSALVFSILLTLLFGLSAMKLLPALEFVSVSSRGAGVSYQEYLGNPILLSAFWNTIIAPFSNMPFSASIGITSFILLIFGLFSWRKKIVLFSILLALFSILLASGTFLAQLLYQLPGFSQMRHIERAMVLFVFAAPIIASFGYKNLVSQIKKNNSLIKENMIFFVVLLFILIELVFIPGLPKSIDITEPSEIPILNEISLDESDFRVANTALSTPIGASGYNYNIQVDVTSIKGGGGIWMNDYVRFIAIAHQVQPTKLFGILNGKYIISDKELDDSNLELINVYESCLECPIWEAYGPYLYQNTLSVPSAFIAGKSVLVLGNTPMKDQLIYDLLMNYIDPSSYVLIEDELSISNIVLKDLKKYEAVILLDGSVTQSDIPRLTEYVKGGGLLFPNLIDGETSISEESISQLFNSTFKPTEVSLNRENINKYSLEVGNLTGWLVVGERFAHFPGWNANINGKQIKIFKANKVISAVQLDGDEGTVEFTYNPKSFRNGLVITIITIIILITYFIRYANLRRKNGKNQS